MSETLLHVFPSFATGGAQVRTVELANTILADKKHIFVSLDRDFSAAERLQGHVCHSLLFIGCRKASGPDFGNLKMFRRLMAERRPSALLTYNWGSIEAALANRIAPICPHLHFEDGFGPDEATGRQHPRRVWARRVALSGKSTIVVPSKTLLGVARSIWRFRSARLRYIPNGIDVDRFAKPEDDKVEPFRKSDDEILIGAVGALRREKNIKRLLRLFADVKPGRPLRLIIVGDGPERANLERLARNLCIDAHVTFTGAVDAPERILKDLDLFVLTSDTEQMPYCLIEAMAAGLPIVATDVGDIQAMLSTANKPFVAPPEAETLLKAQLMRLIERPELRRTIGEQNRLHARERFDRQTMLEEYHHLFESVLGA
jgi:glycosyltransferase involved in cell wall biosynthesis